MSAGESTTQCVVSIEVAHHEATTVEVQHQGLTLVMNGNVQTGVQRSTIQGQLHVAHRIHLFDLAAIGEG